MDRREKVWLRRPGVIRTVNPEEYRSKGIWQSERIRRPATDDDSGVTSAHLANDEGIGERSSHWRDSLGMDLRRCRHSSIYSSICTEEQIG